MIFLSNEDDLSGFPATVRPDRDFWGGVLGVWHM